jgi:hypothetical protein
LRIDVAKPDKAEKNDGVVPDTARRTRAGPRAIASALDRLMARSRRRRGFIEAGLLVDWEAIVGADLAAQALPDRLAAGRDGAGGTLYLCVAAGWATDIQHLAPSIIERINQFFGYRVVARLKLRQGLLSRRTQPWRRHSRPLTRIEERRLSDAIATVQDPALAAALDRLGRAVLGADADAEAPHRREPK